MATAIFSYDGQPQEIEGWPDYMPPGGVGVIMNMFSRDQKWREIDLCSNVTNLGYGPALWNGQEVQGFYYQATEGSASQVADKVGLAVFQLGDLLFFSPEIPPPARLRPAPEQGGVVTLRTQVIRLAHDNPGPIRDALLPLLAHDKTAIAPDTNAFIAWALQRGEARSANQAQAFLERVLKRPPTEAAAMPRARRGPLTEGEWVRADKYRNTNELNTDNANRFHDQFGTISQVGAEGVTVTFESGDQALFYGFASGKKTGLYRGKPLSQVAERVVGPRTMIELVYLRGGQQVPPRRDREALAEYVQRGLERGESRSKIYHTGFVAKFTFNKRGEMYFTLGTGQRDRPVSVNPAVGRLLYIGTLGHRPGGWKSEAARMGVQGV